MLTKSQKVVMYIIGCVTIVLGIITCIPFRTLTFINSNANIFVIENVLKFIVFPIVTLGLVVYPNILKYKQINANEERSKTINVLSYLPILVLISSLLVFVLHTLTFKYYPTAVSTHNVLVAMITIYLVMLICAMFCYDKITMMYKKNGNIIIDVITGALLVVFAVLSYSIIRPYCNLYKGEEDFIFTASNYDPYLLGLYIYLIIFTGIYLWKLIRLINTEETLVCITNPSASDTEKMIGDAYDAAYNDVLDDLLNEYEEFFSKGVEEIAPVEKTKEEEIKEVEYSEKKRTALQELEQLNSYLGETDSKNTEEIAAKAEEIRSQIEREKNSLDGERAELEELREKYSNEVATLQEQVDKIEEEMQPQEEEPVEVVEKRKVLKPTCDQMVAFAETLREEDWQEKGEIKDGIGQIRYFKGKLLFLIIQGTKNDYRITFLTTEKKWPVLLTSVKGINVPKNAKGNKWLKFVNKGISETGVVKGLIRESIKGANEEIEMIKKAKEEAKTRKLAERKAQREAEKAAKQQNSEEQTNSEEQAM